MLKIYGVGRKEAMIKFVAVILFFCFAECAAGSCLNYGHACWGAHGKRSENPTMPQSPERPRTMKTRWFLSKLIQGPLDYRYLRENDLDLASRHSSDPLFAPDDVENRVEQWHKNQDALPEDQPFDDSFLNTLDSNRIRMQKVMEKRSTSQN